jgi:hypothetical protein
MMKEERTIRACAANFKVVAVRLNLFLLGFHMIFDVHEASMHKTFNDYVYGLCTLNTYMRAVEALS